MWRLCTYVIVLRIHVVTKLFFQQVYVEGCLGGEIGTENAGKFRFMCWKWDIIPGNWIKIKYHSLFWEHSDFIISCSLLNKNDFVYVMKCLSGIKWFCSLWFQVSKLAFQFSWLRLIWVDMCFYEVNYIWISDFTARIWKRFAKNFCVSYSMSRNWVCHVVRSFSGTGSTKRY